MIEPLKYENDYKALCCVNIKKISIVMVQLRRE